MCSEKASQKEVVVVGVFAVEGLPRCLREGAELVEEGAAVAVGVEAREVKALAEVLFSLVLRACARKGRRRSLLAAGGCPQSLVAKRRAVAALVPWELVAVVVLEVRVFAWCVGGVRPPGLEAVEV